MRRKGNCWNNAAMENCFGTLETELMHQACRKTHAAARHDLFACIAGYHNRQPLHSALGYISPRQAERQAAYFRARQIAGRSIFLLAKKRQIVPSPAWPWRAQARALCHAAADPAARPFPPENTGARNGLGRYGASG